MDVHNKKTRSYNMSKIKSKDTKPEILVRKICHQIGLRYRLHQKIYKSKPDLIFKKHKTVIFVNGCFWHSHNCKSGNVSPKTNVEFWKKKRHDTILRDMNNYKELNANGWRVVIIWECETKDIIILKKKIKNFFLDTY